MTEFNKELCDERHDQIDKKLDKIIRLLEGNGKPGLKSDVERLVWEMGFIRWIAVVVVGRILWLMGVLIQSWVTKS